MLFTSEAVAAGHPDKLADRISDAIVDAALRQDPKARCAIETLVTNGLCVVAGETTARELPFADIARRVIRDTGYAGDGFSPDVEVITRIQPQSPEVGGSVEREGAGDQGHMFGFACDETVERMPAALLWAHEILRRLEARRRRLPELGPDGKSQVTVRLEGERLAAVDTVVVSQMHDQGFEADRLRALVSEVVYEVLPGHLCQGTWLMVNPSGSFTLGGPAVDTGLTGRKIVVDTYGGAAPHGGGAFSGKDPSKVDRSGAYAARWLAKNVVAAGLARRCLVQVAYAIGVAEPVGLYVNSGGTGVIPDEVLAQRLRAAVDLRPRAIRERLGLDRPIYERTASGGHFGRAPEDDGGFSWEREDLASKLAG